MKNDPTLTLMPVGSPTVIEIRFDPSKPPAGDIRFRKGVIAAVDVQTIIATILLWGPRSGSWADITVDGPARP